MGVSEGEERGRMRQKKIFEETVAEYFLKPIKDTNPKNSNEEKFKSKEEKH